MLEITVSVITSVFEPVELPEMFHVNAFSSGGGTPG